MSTPKHTHGPWTHDTVWNLITAGNGAVEVAACHAGRGADADANAALIASAPDMLEALKAARAAMTAELERQPGHWGITNALELVSAIIAKAQGRDK